MRTGEVNAEKDAVNLDEDMGHDKQLAKSKKAALDDNPPHVVISSSKTFFFFFSKGQRLRWCRARLAREEGSLKETYQHQRP